MRHARPDYNRIQDPSGKIPADEPVFLLRGQDKLAADTVRFWAFAAERKRLDPEMIHIAIAHATVMESWGKKLPDLRDAAERATEPQEEKRADPLVSAEGRGGGDKDTAQEIYRLLRRFYVDSLRAESELYKKHQALLSSAADFVEQDLVCDVELHTWKLAVYRTEKALKCTLDLLMPGWFDVDAGGIISDEHNLQFISADPDEHLAYLVLHGADLEEADVRVQEAMRERGAQ